MPDRRHPMVTAVDRCYWQANGTMRERSKDRSTVVAAVESGRRWVGYETNRRCARLTRARALGAQTIDS